MNEYYNILTRAVTLLEKKKKKSSIQHPKEFVWSFFLK